MLRIKKKFDQWRSEPEEVRLRIATTLTATTGFGIALVWFFILLPLQLVLTRPSEPDAVTQELKSAVESVQEGEVAGAKSTPSPTPTPTPDVQYLHGTRPSRQGLND